jgi:prolyl-tRNA synthetase
MFADLELIGVPYRFVISDKGLDAGTLEFKARTDAEPTHIPMADALPMILERLRKDLGK